MPYIPEELRHAACVLCEAVVVWEQVARGVLVVVMLEESCCEES